MAPGPLPAERFLTSIPAAAWKSRRELRFGLDILRHGVCDGCSLGSSGLRDQVQEGLHLCRLRLADLSRWTRPALQPDNLPDSEELRSLDPASLNALGRLPIPLLWRRGEPGFKPMHWVDADKLLASRISAARERWSLLVDSRSSTNEGYFVLRRMAAELRARHSSLVAPMGYGRMLQALGRSFGLAASTCSLSDLLRADLVVVFGAALGQHPLLAGWLRQARAGSARVVLVGEPTAGSEELGQQSYSHAQAGAGPFLRGVLKACADADLLNQEFLRARVRNGDAWSGSLGSWAWPDLEQAAGTSRQEMAELAGLLAAADKAVFVVGEDFAAGRYGSASCKALLALVLANGLVGREGCGVLALGGGVGGQAAHDCGFVVHDPEEPEGGVLSSEDELIYSVGTSLAQLLDQHALAVDELSQVPLRVHQAHYLDSSMLVEPAELTLLLPMQSRYEQRGGGTATGIDRWIRFSPEVRGHPVGEARPDWQVPAEIVARIPGQLSDPWVLPDSTAVRAAMDTLLPRYGGVLQLHAAGHGIQWGGPQLHCEGFAGADGCAQLSLEELLPAGPEAPA